VTGPTVARILPPNSANDWQERAQFPWPKSGLRVWQFSIGPVVGFQPEFQGPDGVDGTIYLS